jgi:hypothetical protein
VHTIGVPPSSVRLLFVDGRYVGIARRNLGVRTMAKKSPVVVERTMLMNAGIAIASIPESESDIVLGFKTARDPELVSMRVAVNEQRRAALKAQLLAG